MQAEKKIGHFWRISCTAFRLLINHLLPITQKPLSVPVRPWSETYLQLARLEEEGSKNNLPEMRWYEAVPTNDGWSYNVLLMISFSEPVQDLYSDTQMIWIGWPKSEKYHSVRSGSSFYPWLFYLKKKKEHLNVLDCETLFISLKQMLPPLIGTVFLMWRCQSYHWLRAR